MATRSGDIERLVADLASDDATCRDAAIARLRVIGERAVERITAVACSDASVSHRIAAVRALEGIGDSRARAAALIALSDADSGLRIAAVGVLRSWLTSEEGTHIFETVTAVALDGAQAVAVRRAALDALAELPVDIVAPIVARAVAEVGDEPPTDHPASLREWITATPDAPLSQLHGLVLQARERERAATANVDAADWLLTRGALHAAIARRDSRVALYDLRETFEMATAPLPIDFLSAIATIGDLTCLEPLARAWSATPDDQWWREQISNAASTIARRLRLTPRSAAMKRLLTKWPGFT